MKLHRMRLRGSAARTLREAASGVTLLRGCRYNLSPMNHHDAEITEVVVVLDCKGEQAVNEALGKLRGLGLEVFNINGDEGVIEGSIDASRVHELKSVPGVCYVRSVFSYTADFPAGDPRDKDGPDPSCEDEE
jgi:hypothetical protein